MEGSPEVAGVEGSGGVTLLNGVMKVERMKDYLALFSLSGGLLTIWVREFF